MVQMQILRAKLKILDVSYGTGTGKVALFEQLCYQYMVYLYLLHNMHS